MNFLHPKDHPKLIQLERIHKMRYMRAKRHQRAAERIVEEALFELRKNENEWDILDKEIIDLTIWRNRQSRELSGQLLNFFESYNTVLHGEKKNVEVALETTRANLEQARVSLKQAIRDETRAEEKLANTQLQMRRLNARLAARYDDRMTDMTSAFKSFSKHRGVLSQ